MEIVAADIGGTNARFALARLEPNRRPVLGSTKLYRCSEHSGLASAWRQFERDIGGELPRRAAIAVAGPIDGAVVRFPNSGWVVDAGSLKASLDVDEVHLLNDFAAAAHAAAWLDSDELLPIAGSGAPSDTGVTTVLGPGTGLGVAQLVRDGAYHRVIATEGGHIDFAPLDELEQRILDWLRGRFVRVSTERIVSGPGLANIQEALAAIDRKRILPKTDAELWASALDGSDELAALALDRMVMSLGSVAGDLALAHGANQVILIGSLSNRLIDRLRSPIFHQRFCAKGRFAARMAVFPIRLATFQETGLLGAAAAFSAAHAGAATSGLNEREAVR